MHCIPQVLPAELYEQHLVGLIEARPLTVRTYASLCLARTFPDITTWARAAKAVRLPAAVGTATARACSARMRVDSPTFTQHLQDAAADLLQFDYRTIEDTVRHRTQMSRWFDEWVRIDRPHTRDTDRIYAVTWWWLHIAHAHPDTAPLWDQVPNTAAARARYRRFENSLTEADQRSLTSAFHKRA